MGVLLGTYIHHDYVKWGTAGRAAFLAHQSARFDRDFLAPHNVVFTLVVSTILAFIFLGVYELLAEWFSRLFPRDS